MHRLLVFLFQDSNQTLGFIGVAILSALITILLVKPLTVDGMEKEDVLVRYFYASKFLFLSYMPSSENILKPTVTTRQQWVCQAKTQALAAILQLLRKKTRRNTPRSLLHDHIMTLRYGILECDVIHSEPGPRRMPVAFYVLT